MAADTTTVTKPGRKFKGAGTPITQRVETQQPVNPLPFSVVIPLQFPNTIGETLKTTTDIAESITSNFKNMLLTNYGERIGKPDFGADLESMLSERISQEEWNSQVSSKIRETTRKYMPYVTIDSISSSELKAINDGFSRTVVSVVFSVANLGIQGRRIDLTLTNLS